MKRMITVLATALLASSLLAGAADARGGGGGGGGHGGGFGGGFGGGGHMGGGFGGGGHIGGFGGGGHVGGIGGEHMGGLGGGGHVGGHIGAHGFRTAPARPASLRRIRAGIRLLQLSRLLRLVLPASRPALAAELQLSPSRKSCARADGPEGASNALRTDRPRNPGRYRIGSAPPSRSSRRSTGTGEPP